MAKVYSWQVSNSRQYAYIVHPDYIDDGELEVYIGNELTGNNLQKVIDWTSNCTNEEYIQQFDKLKQKCIDENYNVVFEHVEVYMNVNSTCDNLRGPAGRGISLIRTIGTDPITNINTIAIFYDDDTHDTFEVKNGSDGKDGKDGKDGTNGYDGVSSKFIMVYGTGIQETEGGNIIPPNRPEGGKYNFITNELEFDENETDLASQGWYRNDNLEGVIYMSSRTFTTSESSTDKEWTIPVRISGDKGETGKDGKSIEFIYNLTQNEPDVTYLESPNVNNFVPDVDGWTASPTGVDENNTKEWCSIRTYDSELSKWGAWQKATIWSNYGVNGQDGDGVDYIYLNNDSATPPLNPTPKDYESNQEYQNINSEWIPAENQSYVNINNEIVKFTETWTDNPNGVNEKKQYEWVVSRKYRTNNKGKSWSAFSNPSLWAKYSEDGKPGSIGPQGPTGPQGPAGQDGQSGKLGKVTYPAGKYSDTAEYISNSVKAPYVMDTDGNYYLLKESVYWYGGRCYYSNSHRTNYNDVYKYLSIDPEDLNTSNTVNGTGDAGNGINFWCGVECKNDNFNTKYKQHKPTLDNATSVLVNGKKYIKQFYNESGGGANYVGHIVWTLNSDRTEVIMASKFIYSTDGTPTNIINSISTQTPSQNVSNPVGLKIWEKFESFEAVYAKIAMIDNGTIGSAVYSGDYMFSQQGTKSDGSFSDDFENFNPSNIYGSNSPFNPNICINFKTGEMWVNGGKMFFDNGNVNLSGFINKVETQIIADQIEEYFDIKYGVPADNRYELDITKLGSFIFLVDNTNSGETRSNPVIAKDKYVYIYLPSPNNPYFNALSLSEQQVYLTKVRSLLGSTIFIYNNTTPSNPTGSTGYQGKFTLNIGTGTASLVLEQGYVAILTLTLGNDDTESYIWSGRTVKSVFKDTNGLIVYPGNGFLPG